MILTFLKILFSYINKLGAYSLSFSFLFPTSSLLLTFIFLISYCSLTLFPDDSRFALMTAPLLCPLFLTAGEYFGQARFLVAALISPHNNHVKQGP